ncbi:hypothetical protein C8R45DRAFT_934661 [Mycena sanguinolenta]|nr:hypothetical protein C8R45DRAFT_934661 [Mycena sanguinolenta]
MACTGHPLRDQMQPVDAELTVEADGITVTVASILNFSQPEGVVYTFPEEGSVRHTSAAPSALGGFLKIQNVERLTNASAENKLATSMSKGPNVLESLVRDPAHSFPESQPVISVELESDARLAVVWWQSGGPYLFRIGVGESILNEVMAKFGSVQVRATFSRTPNLNFGPVQRFL